MEECANCDRLRKLVSPKEDRQFTALFKKKEPKSYYKNVINWSMSDGVVSCVVRPSHVWFEAFKTEPSDRQIAMLTNTLIALGWTRTKRLGQTYVVMSVPNLIENYGK